MPSFSPQTVRRIRLAGLCLSLAVSACAVQSQGEIWNLPLPEGEEYRPLASLTEWRQPSAFKTLEAASTGVRNTASSDTVADRTLGESAGLVPGRGTMTLRVALRCRRDRAIWIGVGRDDIDLNGALDGAECRLMAGLDRGRWGLRQSALGETTWAQAIIPPEGTLCTMEIVVNAAGGAIESVYVTDSAARRSPPAFADFDPGWSDMSAAEATAWTLFRVEARGEGAELLGFSLESSGPAMLILK